VSDIAGVVHECLTVYSYVESYTLASIAWDYIQTHGTSDPVCIAYFGVGQTNSNLQSEVFSVCPDYPDSRAFLIAPNSGRGQ
jgi:hypothetical protein